MWLSWVIILKVSGSFKIRFWLWDNMEGDVLTILYSRWEDWLLWREMLSVCSYYNILIDSWTLSELVLAHTFSDWLTSRHQIAKSRPSHMSLRADVLGTTVCSGVIWLVKTASSNYPEITEIGETPWGLWARKLFHRDKGVETFDYNDYILYLADDSLANQSNWSSLSHLKAQQWNT